MPDTNYSRSGRSDGTFWVLIVLFVVYYVYYYYGTPIEITDIVEIPSGCLITVVALALTFLCGLPVLD
jgi:hypothetical protein